jgi:tetratricopeptide (TPR) repeat protein
MEQYSAAEEKLQKCINLNLKYPSCYWMMALVKGYEQNETEFKKYFDMAKEDQGIDLNAPENLEQLANVYIKTSNYKKLTEVYPQLIAVETDPVAKAQLYASLAASYKELDDIVKARQAVLKIKDIIPSIPLDLQAGVAKDVENFLKILQ